MHYRLKGKITKGLSYQIDQTLTVEGVGADSKAVGDAIALANQHLANHLNNKNNPHGLTKVDIGLENVDNTSDENKPVSIAQSIAIADAKKAGTTAQIAADNAQTAANMALSRSDNAQTSANNAQTAADNAKTAADNAQSTAYNAQTAANNAQSTANGKVSKNKIAVTLALSGWSNNSQTVSASGVTADNDIIVSPAPESFEDYAKAIVRCTGQSSDWLTFTCKEVPTTSLIVNVMILT